ncbi:MAG: hypothetical protein JW798_09250 [Prolixibacteraceae bacterium]|nr:hypothetical protein [Prolixibacteraceae bacterium]
MKEKILRITIYLLGFISLYAFIAVRAFPLMNTVLNEKMDQETQDFNRYGDLYYFSCIKDFQEDFPPKVRKYRQSEDNPDIHQADILTYGDSFFDMIFVTSLPERLSEKLNQKVYSYVTQDPTQANPFCLLESVNFNQSDSTKYFIYETVERNIPEKFSTEYTTSCDVIKKQGASKLFENMINLIFRRNSENLYEVMLKQSHFTNKVYSAIASLKFNWFGYISTLTARYKKGEQPWLFYKKEYGTDPGCFYYSYSEEEIERYADNVKRMRDKLFEQYNLELIFMPIPNKYSLYHKFINNDQYNNFLPKLHTALDKRNINYIDIYEDFSKSADTLYYGTDTHWNSEGIDLALNLTLNKINRNHSLSLNTSEKK